MTYKLARRIAFCLAAAMILCILIGLFTKNVYLLWAIAAEAIAIAIVGRHGFRCPSCGNHLPDLLLLKPLERCPYCGIDASKYSLLPPQCLVFFALHLRKFLIFKAVHQPRFTAKNLE